MYGASIQLNSVPPNTRSSYRSFLSRLQKLRPALHRRTAVVRYHYDRRISEPHAGISTTIYSWTWHIASTYRNRGCVQPLPWSHTHYADSFRSDRIGNLVRKNLTPLYPSFIIFSACTETNCCMTYCISCGCRPCNTWTPPWTLVPKHQDSGKLWRTATFCTCGKG